MQAKNPIFADDTNQNIDLIITHPVFGEIPFTASQNDVEETGRDLFVRALAGEFGQVAAFVPPAP